MITRRHFVRSASLVAGFFAVPGAFAEELMRAADILNSGERVAILVGAGARNASEEIIKVAET